MEPKITINGTEYPFVTPDLLDLGEAAEAERITGQGYDLFKGGALGLLALVYISVKRVNAAVELEDIRILNFDDFQLNIPKKDGTGPLEQKPSDGSGENDGSSNESSPPDSAGSETTPEHSGTPV